jgi:hypothetical protein
VFRERSRRVGFLERRTLLGQAKVEQLYTFFGHQDVIGLEIPMRDPLAVRRIQHVQNLTSVFGGFL